MIGTGDAFGLIDRLAAWLPDALKWLPAKASTYLVVPLVVAVIYVVPRVVVHRVLPWAGRYLVIPVAAVVFAAVAAAALIVDVVVARAFRLVGLPLTGAHYAIGDWAIAGSRGLRSATRYRVRQAAWWLRGFSPAALLVAAIAITVMWNVGYCARHQAAGCADPLGQWWHEVWAWGRSVWRELSP